MPTSPTRVALISSGGATLALAVLLLTQIQEMQRFALRFDQPSGPEGWTTTVRLELRPPHLSWWLGWQMHGCEPIETPEDLPRFQCLVDVPSKWGCAEIRGYASAFQIIDPEDLDQGVRSLRSEGYSNTVVAGDCPDPMPERVPLATPEPGLGISLAFGVLGIGYSSRRRRGTPNRVGARRDGGSICE